MKTRLPMMVGYFGSAVVIAGDSARADVGVAADGGIAEIAEVRGLRSFVQNGVFHFDEAANMRASANVAAGAEAGKRPNLRFRSDASTNR